MEKTIFEKPVFDAICKIDDSDKKSILLVGNNAAGKSTVVDNYLKFNSAYAVDCTYTEDELLLIRDKKVYILYHICMIIEKILKYIESTYPICINYLKEYQANIKIILFNIRNLFMIDNYDKKEELFGKELCEHPEKLLDEFCIILKRYFDYEWLTLVLDNFDKLGSSSSRFQLTIYKLLSDRLRTIYVVSDIDVINDSTKRKELQVNNEIVDVNYSTNIEYVKKILDLMFVRSLSNNKIVNLKERPSFIFNTQIIELLIEITNGNLNEMYNIVFNIYKNKRFISPEYYERFIKDYYYTNIYPIKEMQRERKLHI